MKITNDILYVGVNDRKVDLFEGQYKVPCGMSYNSYIITDKKIAVMDTVDANFTHEWLDNIQNALGGKSPDYLIVQHMEPDHSAKYHEFHESVSERNRRFLCKGVHHDEELLRYGFRRSAYRSR